jgi:hypothetical protein
MFGWEGVMDDMAAVNVFQQRMLPETARAVLLEEGEAQECSVTDGIRSTYVALTLPGCRPIQIPREWEVTAGDPVTLKNWVAAQIQAALAGHRSRPR